MIGTGMGIAWIEPVLGSGGGGGGSSGLDFSQQANSFWLAVLMEELFI